MKLLELFNECMHGGYNNTKDYISYKIVGKILYLQCSHEKEDWLKNFDVRPVEVWINREPCIVPNGFHQAMDGVIGIISGIKDIEMIVGYSHGAAVGALLSGATGIPAIVFGCPKFIFRPNIFQEKLFYKLTIYNNKNDVVSKVPPFYSVCGNVNILPEKAKKTGTWLEWNSHHSPNRYRQNLEGL